ncbi:M23 family metallopeptidase [Streptomyces sp. NPDC127119]|uniref:M23 family metallopeptidase n=1 Tax=Streptomyces sp. NPDC127119 TaxID=3345370 RepID=UPI003632A66D
MPTLYLPFRGAYGIVRGFTGTDYRRHHTGIDYRTPHGTPILASAAGTVVKSVDLTYSYGRFIVVAHADKTFTVYAHLYKRQAPLGARVAAGQQIGLSGNTGNSSGPHLHFEVRKGRNSSGATVNPRPLLRGNPPVAAALAGLPETGAAGAAGETADLTELIDLIDLIDLSDPADLPDLAGLVDQAGLADEPDTVEAAGDVPAAGSCGSARSGDEGAVPMP